MTSYTDETTRNYDYLFKLIIIGESGVGKSSILMRYIDDAFTTSFINTIGIDFKIRNIMHNNKRIKLQIWDTAGQERFRTITTAYYRGANGILLVYDTNKISTYQSLTKWLKCIDAHASDNIPVVLVGSKTDTPLDREISAEVGRRRAEESGMDFMEVSAKTGDNVEELFGLITKKMYDSNVIVSSANGNNSGNSSNSGNSGNSSNSGKKDKKDKHNSKNDIAKLTFNDINDINDINGSNNIGSLDTFASGKNGKNGCIIL